MGAPSGIPISAGYIWFVMAKAAHAIAKQIDEDLQKYNLSNTDFRILEALLSKGPLPVNVIGPKVGLTPGSISTAVERLLSRGLVTRKENPRDKRIRTVGLTPAGKKIIAPAFESHMLLLETLMQPLTEAQRREIAGMMKLLGRHAQAVSEETER